MYFRLHLGRKAVWILLIVLALLAVYPVIFLSVGSLMGADELEDCLGAVVSGAEGYASFPVLSKYPTLQHFVEVLFAGVFRHVLEFYPDHVRSPWRAVCGRNHGGMGICQIRISM